MNNSKRSMSCLRLIVSLRNVSLANKYGLVTTTAGHAQGSRRRFYSDFGEHMKSIVQRLESILKCTQEKALEIYDDFPSVRSTESTKYIKVNVDILQKFGVADEEIIDNAYLLIMDKDLLQWKLEQFNAIDIDKRNINDFVPLLQMKRGQILEFCKQAAKDERNRIYHFSDKLGIEPKIVAEYFARNEKFCTGPFKTVDHKIQIMLDYNIKPMSILKGLYALDRSVEMHVLRLEQLEKAGCAVHIHKLTSSEETFREVLKHPHSTSGNSNYIESKNDEKSHFESATMASIGCTDEEAAQIYYTLIDSNVCVEKFNEKVDFLIKNGIDKDTIKSTTSLLMPLPLDTLERRMQLLSQMRASYYGDLLPLVSIDDKKLLKIIKNFNDDEECHNLDGHPIYYFSRKLNRSAIDVSIFFAKSPEALLTEPSLLRRKLDILLANGVDEDSILKAAAPFEITSETIESRLDELKKLQLDKIRSYMIVEPISTTIASKMRKDKQKIALSKYDGNAFEYVSSRLGWSEEEAREVARKRPTISKITFEKAEEFTDFILNETHFTGADVQRCIRVIGHKVEETRARYQELDSIGVRPEGMGVLTLDRKRYIEWLRRYCKSVDTDEVWTQFSLIEKRVKEKNIERGALEKRASH